ncbi:MAG: PorP/SprF family type IX secretion system membrane protein [Owenweeksia sp.]|nr:PorP/SprF family type IX secretion system membrane protein [Owenweeksia sp.]
MKLNKSILMIAALALGLTTQAQQIPLYSNYFFTPYVYNPAMSGTEGYTEATLLHRRQWTGVQGSPETSALAVNGSLNEQKVGWSAYGFVDQTDIISRQGIYGNYAYHVNLSENAILSFGLGAGYLNNNISISDIRAQDQNDVFFITNGDRGTFDLNAGIKFQIADFQLGAAAPQLIGQSITYAETPTRAISYGLLRHYVFNAQYDFKFSGDKRVLSPLVMVRAAKNVPIQVDAGMIFNLKEYGYIGAMYRSEYAVTGNLGVNLTDQLTVGYAYDFSLNEYGSQLGTSHEFMLTYRFGDNRRNERLENEIKRLKQQQRSQQDETEELVDEKLEEFKDEYERELEEQMKQAAEKAAQEAAENTAQTGSQSGTTPRDGQTGRQTGGTGTDQQQGQQGQQGQTGTQPGSQTGRQGVQDGGRAPSEVTPGSMGYYLVAGVFSNKTNADRLRRRLESDGVEAALFQDPGNFYYYVFLRKYDSYQAADQAKANNMGGQYRGDLWIKIVK